MANTSLSRLCTGSLPDSARYKFTFSGWFKISGLNTSAYVFNAYATGDFRCFVAFDTDKLVLKNFNSGTLNTNVQTSQVFRDTSAWYHVVVTGDTTQATASDRVKFYVNGEEVTSYSATTYPSQNSAFELGTGGGAWTHYVGSGAGGDYFNGSMAHVHYTQQYAYTASDFGETDATTGIWKPKTSPSVTYNVNSWFLKFENSGSMGTDSSGNANNFTVNGTMTQTIDTPSNVFATLNPLYVPSASPPTFSNGNLTAVSGSTSYFGGASNLGVSSGKWYWEVKIITDNDNPVVEIGNVDDYTPLVFNSNNGVYLSYSSTGYGYCSNGNKRNNNSETSFGNTYTTNDVIGVALDLDNNKLYFAKNGVWQNSGDPTSGASGTGSAYSVSSGKTYVASCGDGSSTGTETFSFNFGNGYFGTTAVSSAENPDDGIGIFEYAVPTGYKALCTKSINSQEYS